MSILPFRLRVFSSLAMLLAAASAVSASTDSLEEEFAVRLDSICESAEARESETCRMLAELGRSTGGDPIVIPQVDPRGRRWQVKLYFGPTRTRYFPTTVRIDSRDVRLAIRDFAFRERTSLEHYDPRTWKSLPEAFQWLDEPTNRLILRIDDGKNAFFVSLFHPKFVTAPEFWDGGAGTVEGTMNGRALDGRMQIGNDLPLVIQNTHRQMEWQVGYGRDFVIRQGRVGRLVYEPHFALGITTGKSNTGYADAAGEIVRVDERNRIQGFNATLGHTLEYSRGKLSVFADESLTGEKITHAFADGKAKYGLVYHTVSVGIGITLFSRRAR